MFDLLDAACRRAARRPSARRDRRCPLSSSPASASPPRRRSAAATSPSAYRLDTPDGPLFAKTHPDPMPGAVRAGGRRAAGAAGDRRHRRARGRAASGPLGLVLEWIDVGAATAGTEADLGRRLAAAAPRRPGPRFGGLDDAPRRLPRLAARRPHTDRRLGRVLRRAPRPPLTARAVELGRLDPAALALVERVAAAPPSCAVRPSRRRCCTATCGPATGSSTAAAPTG